MGTDYFPNTYTGLACFLCFFFVLIRTWRRRHLYYSAFKVNGPIPFPLIGSAYVFFGHTQNILESFTRLKRKYGLFYKLWMSSDLYFVVMKLDHVKAILNNCSEKFSTMKFVDPVFGKGLLTLPATEWKIHRKLLGGTLNQEILNSYVDIFANYSNVLVEKLEGTLDAGFVDMFPIFAQCMTDVLCGTILGTDLKVMKKNGPDVILWTAKLGELSVLRIFNPLLHPDFMWKKSSLSKQTNAILHNVQRLIKKILESKRREKSYLKLEQEPNLLNYMLKLENTETTWNEEMSAEETQAFLIAGADATSLTLGYVLMMLAMHQEIQKQVFDELDFVFGGSNRNVTLEDLHQLSLLERVVKETLRIFPVAPLVGRYFTEDLVVGNFTFPKGSSAFIPILCIHRDNEIWPNPLKFDPDRFLPGETAKRHPFSFIPFSGGPRKCLGPTYGYMSMKVVLATILRHYKVVATSYREISEIEMKIDVSARCVKGQNVILHKR
ncbi:cytochrome P450 4C1-like [Zophobas morio]|uniref:cytochrome P450 4C1-like n=1 Tax=Zophobas morio TaxID=2755281 RepID=UPI003083D8C3